MAPPKEQGHGHAALRAARHGPCQESDASPVSAGTTAPLWDRRPLPVLDSPLQNRVLADAWLALLPLPCPPPLQHSFLVLLKTKTNRVLISVSSGQRRPGGGRRAGSSGSGTEA